MRLSELHLMNGSLNSNRNVCRWFETMSIDPDAGLRVFLFPYAGGNSYAYRTWQRHMPAGVQLCPAQLPGRGRRLGETPYTRVAPLVADLSADLAAFARKPFALFGHSMGGLIAFELARQMDRDYGVQPAALIISACTAAHRIRCEKPVYDLPDQELIDTLGSYGGTPPEVLKNREIMQVLLPTIRADLELVQTYSYRPGSQLACPFHIFAGSVDKNDSASSVQPWIELTEGPSEFTLLPGGHFFNFAAPHIFLSVLRDILGPHV